MAKKTGIKLIDEYKKKPSKKGACPVCGAPGGKYKCEECDWGVEELGKEYSTSLKDPVSTIMEARFNYSALKKERNELDEKVKGLIENNKKLSELVEAYLFSDRAVQTVSAALSPTH